MYITIILTLQSVQVNFPCRTESDIEPHTINQSHTVFSFPTEIQLNIVLFDFENILAQHNT